MTDKEVRQWYDAHGIEYLPEDWGDRDESGESAGKQSGRPERVGREPVVAYDPESLAQLEGKKQTTRGGLGPDILTLLWEQREDHVVLAALEEFFTPYLSWMPAAKRRVLDEYLLGRRTQEDIAGELGVDQSTVSRHLRAAVRWVVRELGRDIRQDLPDDTDVSDDELAWDVFNLYWIRRFGTPWPLKG